MKFAAGDRQGGGTSGPRLRVALVPVGSPTLLDAVRSDDATLIDRLAGALRTASLVPQAAGIETQVTTSGVSLHSSQSRVWQSTDAAISADGAVWVELDVAANGMLGSGQVDHSRVMATVAGAPVGSRRSCGRTSTVAAKYDSLLRRSGCLTLKASSM